MVLLDCTHMYHEQCLEAFERFDNKPLMDAYNDDLNHPHQQPGAAFSSPGKKYGHACPMCRHPKYKKIKINIWNFQKKFIII